ncbi:MAG: superoxide dismutase family protein [Actinomycetota bacterium]|nr:superoxide dismutase family protein [Actinomycetota bacterium]
MRARRLLAPLALVATLITAPAALAAEAQPKRYVSEHGPLRDLAGNADPTDGAVAHFVAFTSRGTTRAMLFVTGLAPGAVGRTLGAHVHVGPCVAGQPTAAGPHYNTEGPTGPGDRAHEIWLDFTVLPGGIGIADTTVPFVIPAGAAGSVVVHRDHTAPGGAAGPRMACLPAGF